MHTDFHAIAYYPSNPNRVVAGNDGGVWISNDGGQSWANINSNLAITQFYSIAAHPTDESYLIGGTQDNGTLIRGGSGNTWNNTGGSGDGGGVLIDPSNPSTLYRTIDANFQRSDNYGILWYYKTTGLGLNDPKLVNPPIAMDPSNSSMLYYGTNQLYGSYSRGDLWIGITGDLTNGNGAAISTIAVAPSSPQTIYVGTSDGNVQVSTYNAGIYPTFYKRVTGLPTRYVTRIVVDPTNSQVAYVSLSGFGSGHVFKTINGGGNWTDISGNLPDIPANALVLDKSAPNKLYVGTDIGVFVTTDGGSTWFELSTGLPNAAVFDLQINNNTQSLFAATFGRGVFKLARDANLPTINGFSPMSGPIGQAITIQGADFLSVASIILPKNWLSRNFAEAGAWQ